MKYRYKRVPTNIEPAGYSTQPLVQVSLRYRNRTVRLRALIDSGAADCIFHQSVGQALGIDVESGLEKGYTGIAGQTVTGYVHSLMLQVPGFPEWIQIEAGFIESDVISLLGQSGFFDNYQIIFERYRGRFEVNSRTRFHAG